MKAGWELRPLGEVCGFRGGTQPPKSEFVDSPRAGYVRLLQIRDFKSDDKAVFVRDSNPSTTSDNPSCKKPSQANSPEL